jgi:hypothetical protein
VITWDDEEEEPTKWDKSTFMSEWLTTSSNGGSEDEGEAEGAAQGESNIRFSEENVSTENIPIPRRSATQTTCTLDLKPGKTGKSAADFFFKVLPKPFLEEWVTYSNREMDLHFQGQTTARKVYGKLCPHIKPREMYALLAIFLIMGVAHVSNVADCYRYRNKGDTYLIWLTSLSSSRVRPHLHFTKQRKCVV